MTAPIATNIFADRIGRIEVSATMAVTAEAAGDTETAALARGIQREEKATAQKIWSLLPNAAVTAYRRVTSQGGTAATATAH